MNTDYLKPEDISWLELQLRVAGFHINLAKPVETKPKFRVLPLHRAKTYGRGQYQRTYTCGCDWANYCNECQED